MTLLSYANSSGPVPSVLTAAQANIEKEVATIQKLSEVASKHPYYKFNYAWTRHVQDAVSILFYPVVASR